MNKTDMWRLKDMSREDLLDEYNCTRNRVDGVMDGGFGRYELYYLEELLRELELREDCPDE